MPIKAPAIDFSQIGAVTTEAVNKMRKGLYEAMDFDAKKLAEKRTEFMSNLELGQLNQTIRGRAQEVTSNTVNDFLDKWSGIYAEKGGRLSHTDLVKMRQHQINVEQAIEVTNRGVEEFAAAAEAIRGKDGGRYDRETWEENKKIYLEEGKEPEDGFLRIRPKDIFLTASTAKPPGVMERGVQVINTGDRVNRFTKTVYATDEMRDAQIREWMMDEQFSLGAVQKFKELPLEDQANYVNKASEPGDEYIHFAQDLLRGELWQDRIDPQTTPALSPYQQTRQQEEDTTLDRSDTPIRTAPIGEMGRTYDLVDLSDIGMRGVNINVGSAVNAETGRLEDVNAQVSVEGLYGWEPETNKVIAIVKLPEYKQPIFRGGKPLYGLKREGVAQPRETGTKEEMEARAKEMGEEYSTIEMTETKRNASVPYELDKDQYKRLVEGVNLGKREDPKRQRFNDLF